jgi:hypothetical protein
MDHQTWQTRTSLRLFISLWISRCPDSIEGLCKMGKMENDGGRNDFQGLSPAEVLPLFISDKMEILLFFRVIAPLLLLNALLIA